MHRQSPSLLLSLLLLAACQGGGSDVDGGAAPQPADDPAADVAAYEAAVQHAQAGRTERAMAALERALAADGAAVQRALLDPAFDARLRDREDFRSALARAARDHGVSELTLVRAGEPGEPIEIEGRVVGPGGEPVAGAAVDFFATDDAGRYHPELPGERVPRLFALLVTDARGRFVVRTVRPGSYPGTRDARHVHYSIRAEGLRLAHPSYAVFDDDPLLAEPQNAEQRGEALRIRMGGTVDGVTRGVIEIPMR